MVTMTTATVTREHVWTAFRGTHDLRKREWYHSILLLFDGKSYDMAQWLYGNSEERLHDPRRREVQGSEHAVSAGAATRTSW